MLAAYFPSLVHGASVTLALAFLALTIGLPVGLAAAFCGLSGKRFLRGLADGYTLLNRGVPDLVLLLLVFYSLPDALNRLLALLNVDLHLDFDPFVSAVVTLGAISGAYMSQTFRAAFLGVPRGQYESGLSMGMSKFNVAYRILLPQMFRIALPGLTNNWLVLLKATALASLIGLHDLMFSARGASESTSLPFTFYAAAGFLYLAGTWASVFALRLLHQHLSKGLR
ncbi:ABC transporter permease subunit [Paraburkholderia sp. CNPSo 3076]|uniref:ABC transporter permease n=1 Tax=Paraburkholderia sp. CNPSo 3076 TaxID=2940936 RepID=UPI00225A9D3E|nr:ABC transporter permease subunit [Paraburkholderia sp. CNPSo 3076]MCX5544152.1 ABC transporter permease subunit [Paraburkholderia sp. CNPSo 3076]